MSTPDAPAPSDPASATPAFTPVSRELELLFFERLMESLPDVVYFKDREGRFVRVNNAHAQHMGLTSPAAAIGRSDFDFFAQDLAAQKDADEREIVRTGLPLPAKEESSHRMNGDDRWVLTTKLPLYGHDGAIIGTFGISRDITEATRAKRSLQEQHELLRTLIDILPARVSIKDAAGRFRLVNAAFRRVWGLQPADDIQGKLLSELVTDARTTQIAADDRRVLEEGIPILNREEREVLPDGRERWVLLSKVPLRDADGQVQGIVGVATDISAQKEAEARAVHAQHALEEKNEQVEAQLALACELQTELMTSSLQSVSAQLDPGAPFRPRLTSLYEPSAHLAGDFFYLMPVSPTSFALLLCDVMGHGVKAALVTTLIRGLVANLSVSNLRPAAALEQLNERLCGLLDRPSMPRFVTALFAKFDTLTGEVEIANAGHPWPLLRRATGGIARACVTECDPALGLIRGLSYGSIVLSVSPGDRLFAFTDGLIEEVNSSGEEFGTARLATAFADSKHADPADVMAEIALTLRHFSNTSVRRDDYCAVLAAF